VTLVGRLLVVALAVTLVAGCGGGGSKRLSKTEYAAKADAICRKFNSASQASSSSSGLARVAGKLTRLLDQSVKDLRNLKPPADEQATADRWLDRLEAIRGDLAKVHDEAAKKDKKGLAAAVQAGVKDQQRGNELAGRLGLTDCSE
jgi:hypothetical protein